MKASVQLVQFAKWPREGWVKTRLEPALGRQGALKAHIQLTTTVLEQLQASGHPLVLAWDEDLEAAPPEAGPVQAVMEKYRVPSTIQQGGDLGERMTHALSEGLRSAGSAMVIGSDCPSVDAGYIEQARQALDRADVVFGPSDDGGYVLVGARRIRLGMLAGVAWGTDQALEQSMAAVQRAGLSVATLEPRWDVDEPADWDRFIAMTGQSSTGA
ncbi:TIGR04282 family arsenosugar biosynthesis glycosyltransferase [Marinobacter sp.]|uniref:TIGR04282 family arsenosugar biosynthesis glycosyltransferase n=1 Tax=Marinobacter sp. TaxID=50741 RepID=UPI00356A879D